MFTASNVSSKCNPAGDKVIWPSFDVDIQSFMIRLGITPAAAVPKIADAMFGISRERLTGERGPFTWIVFKKIYTCLSNPFTTYPNPIRLLNYP